MWNFLNRTIFQQNLRLSIILKKFLKLPDFLILIVIKRILIKNLVLINMMILPAMNFLKIITRKSPGKIALATYFRVPCTLSFCQKSEKTDEAIVQSKKPYFWHFLAQICPKMFIENWALSNLGHCHFASVCKISWKSIKYSSRNSSTVFPAKIACSGDF